MISLSLLLSLFLSVCLSTPICLSINLSVVLSICLRFVAPTIVTLYLSNFDTNTSVASSLYLPVCLSVCLCSPSFFVFVPFYPLFPIISALFLYSSLSLTASTFLRFAFELNRRDGLFTLASVLVDLTSTQLLFSLSLIKSPTKNQNKIQKKKIKDVSRHSLFPSQKSA